MIVYKINILLSITITILKYVIYIVTFFNAFEILYKNKFNFTIFSSQNDDNSLTEVSLPRKN